MKATTRNAGDARAFIAAGDIIKLHIIGYADGDIAEETDIYITDEMNAADEDYQQWKDEVRVSIDKLTRYWGSNRKVPCDTGGIVKCFPHLSGFT